MWWWRSTALFWLLLLSSCGYTLNHRLKGPFQDPRGIFVPVFSNATDETAAEIVFTNALIQELRSRGNVIFSSREQGGLELKGTVETITYGSTSGTEPGFKGLQNYQRLPTELGVTVTVSLELYDPKTTARLWSGRFDGFRRIPAPISRTYDYEAPSSIGPTTQSVVESIYPGIAQDMMRDVYDEMVELF